MTGPDLETRTEMASKPRADEREEALADFYAGQPINGHASTAEGTQEDDSEPSRPLLRFIPASEFLTDPKPPEWIIDGLAETDSFCVLFGDPESGKSFMAMDWACCIATGRPWKDKPVKQGPVLYINGEGHNGVNRRLTAWAIANGEDLRAAPFFLSSTTTALTDEMARAELTAVVAEFIREHGEPVMVVLDTLARNFGPGDENSTQDMQRAVDTIDVIRTLTKALVIAIHHSGHGDKSRARGSIVLRGAADTEYRMGRYSPGGDTLLEATKMKDGAKPDPMTFRFADVELGVQDHNGNEVTSAVLIQTAYDPAEASPPPPSAAGRGKNQTKALAILQAMYDERRRNIEKSGRDPGIARVTMHDWREACRAADMPSRRAYEATQALIDGGVVDRQGDLVLLAKEGF